MCAEQSIKIGCHAIKLCPIDGRVIINLNPHRRQGLCKSNPSTLFVTTHRQSSYHRLLINSPPPYGIAHLLEVVAVVMI